MEAKHTPGPWAVHDEEGDEWWFGDGQLVVRADNGKAWESIAVMGNGEQDKANFRLIAAAPDLLAAMYPFIARSSSDEFITLKVRTADIERARQAVAKAECPPESAP